MNQPEINFAYKASIKRIRQITCCLFFLFTTPFLFGQNLNKGSIASKNYFEEITFEYLKEKIIIPVTIEGKSYRFILDTGAPNIISKEIQALIKPELIETIPVNDATNNSENLSVVSVNSLYIGSTLFKNTATLVYDLNASKIFGCFKIDGFIGSNMLRNSIVQIDLDAKVVRLTNSKKNLNLDKKDATKIKLVGVQSSPYIWIELKNEKTGRNQVMIDTGSSSFYDLSKKTYKQLKEANLFKFYGKSSGAAAVSLFGDAPLNEHFRIGIPQMKINNFTITNHITQTTNDNDSSIGLGILKYGVMTIDFKNKRFYFKPKTARIDNKTTDFGFSRTLLNNKIVIGFVWDTTLASTLNYGDEILEVNGVKLTDSNFCERLIKSSPFQNEDHLVLQIKDKNDAIKRITVSKSLPENQSFSQN